MLSEYCPDHGDTASATLPLSEVYNKASNKRDAQLCLIWLCQNNLVRHRTLPDTPEDFFTLFFLGLRGRVGQSAAGAFRTGGAGAAGGQGDAASAKAARGTRASTAGSGAERRPLP